MDRGGVARREFTRISSVPRLRAVTARFRTEALHSHRQRNDSGSDRWKDKDGHNIPSRVVVRERAGAYTRPGAIRMASGKITGGSGIDTLQQRGQPGLRVSERGGNWSRANRRGRCHVSLRELRLRRFGHHPSGREPPMAGARKRKWLSCAGSQGSRETPSYSTELSCAGPGSGFIWDDSNCYRSTRECNYAERFKLQYTDDQHHIVDPTG